MAEIRRLDGSIVKASRAKGDPEVVAQLEWMLRRARAGKITAFSAVMRDGETIGTVSRGRWRGGFFEALGVVMTLQHDMITGSRVGPQPDEEEPLGA